MKNPRYVIGSYSSNKTHSIKIPEFSHAYRFDIEMNENDVDLTEGDYIFQIVEGKYKRGTKRTFLKVVPAAKFTGVLDSEYLDSRFRKAIFDIVWYGNDIISNSPYVSSVHNDSIHRCMRILRSLGYDWVPEKHGKKTRTSFCKDFLEKLLSGEFNPYDEYQKCRFSNPYYHKPIPCNYYSDSNKRKFITMFDRDLDFDPKYDTLVPLIECNSIFYGIQEFESSDVGSYMNILISSCEDVEKYQKYVEKDIEFKVIPRDSIFGTEKVFGYYKLPEDGEAFERMLDDARGFTCLTGNSKDTIRQESYFILFVPTKDPTLHHRMIVSPYTFPDLYLMITDKQGFRRIPEFDIYHTPFKVATDLMDGISLEGKELLDIRFENGVRGMFPIKFIATEFEGECKNYTFEKKDDFYIMK